MRSRDGWGRSDAPRPSRPHETAVSDTITKQANVAVVRTAVDPFAVEPPTGGRPVCRSLAPDAGKIAPTIHAARRKKIYRRESRTALATGPVCSAESRANGPLAAHQLLADPCIAGYHSGTGPASKRYRDHTSSYGPPSKGVSRCSGSTISWSPGGCFPWHF